MSTLGSTEERDDLTRAESAQMRRRSLRLLGTLLRPSVCGSSSRRSWSSSRPPRRWPGPP